MKLTPTAVLSKLSTLTGAAREVRAATDVITGTIAEVRQAIVATRRARETAARARRPLDEILTARIPAAVAEVGAWWLHESGSALLYGDSALGAPDDGTVTLPWSSAEPVPWGAVCAGAPALATELLRGLVRALPAWEAGPPMAERPAVVARLEAELAELEALEERTIDAAAAAGVGVEHRPEVQQRRETERRQRELADRAQADRAAREAAINTRHARAPRTGGQG